MTSIRIEAGMDRAVVDLRAGAVVPRLVRRSANTAHVALVAGGALLLGGDEVRISVTVGEGCLLELEDIGGTVAYDADQVSSSWHVRVSIARGGTLLWHGMPFIVASGASVERALAMEIAPSGRACLRETFVLGRAGEPGGSMRIRTDVRLGGKPLLIEELDVRGGVQVPGVLGDSRVMDTVLLAGARPPKRDTTLSTVLHFEEAGAMARSLGSEAHLSSVSDAWADWSRELLN